MKAVLQRVKSASVATNGQTHSEIGPGLLILLGVSQDDDSEKTKEMAQKIAHLRIMADEQGKMNLSVRDTKAEVLVVSQFTLLADTSGGRRPSFIKAADPEKAQTLYELFVGELKSLGIPTQTGQFGEYMQVSLVNDGPVTIILDN